MVVGPVEGINPLGVKACDKSGVENTCPDIAANLRLPQERTQVVLPVA